MGVPTPFHSRIAPLCTSLAWKEWSGYFAPSRYETIVDREYNAFRQAAGLLDVTPLFKYDITGPGAEALLRRVMARDVGRLEVGRVGYGCWCEEDGSVIDDGNVFRIATDHFRVTCAHPAGAWFERNGRGLEVTVTDRSEQVAALALQGPTSRAVLGGATDLDLDGLRYFGLAQGKVGGVEAIVSRTGYTGDLGYEIWVDAGDAEALWDALMEAGRDHGLRPAGLDALDIVRIEAGYILIDVDFYSCRHALIPAQRSNPYELGLGWTVHLDREPFVGQAALREVAARGPRWKLAGLVISWEEVELLWLEEDLPPELPHEAWRTGVPVYATGEGDQIGKATSGVWSSLLKQDLALATLRPEHATPGTEVEVEVTVEYKRKRARATVTELPFFDPERKRA